MDVSNDNLKTTRDIPLTANVSLNVNYKQLFHRDFKDVVDAYSDKYEAKKDFIEFTSLTDRTFDRYYSMLSAPNANNILASFSFIYKESNLEKVFEMLPQYAKDEYAKQIKTSKVKNIDYKKLDLSTPSHKALYIRTMNGNTVDSKQFISEWGNQRGTRAVEELLQKNAIKEEINGLLSKGSHRSNFSTEEILDLAVHVVKNEITKSKLDDEIVGNRTSFHVVNLTSDGVTKAQKAEELYHKTLYDIQSEERGENMYVSTMATITLNEEVLQ